MDAMATALKIRQGQLKLRDLSDAERPHVRRALADERGLNEYARAHAAAKRGPKVVGRRPGPQRVRV